MPTIRYSSAVVLLLALFPAPGAWSADKPAAKGEYLAYIGTYTGKLSKGIYAYRFHAATGKLDPIGLVAETDSPSFLAVHPNRRYLYAVNELEKFGSERGGAVSAFAIDASTGKLSLLNQVSTHGGGPCHLVVDKTGKCLLVANYGGGSVAAVPVQEDGRLGESSTFIQHKGSSVNPRRQRGPHAHSINTSHDGRFAVVTDLGLDEVLVYHLDAAKALLTPNDPPFAKVNPGAGPRHLSFHPNGKFAYVINEMQSSVTALAYDTAHGTFKELQTLSALPKDFTGENSGAEIEVHPTGRFVYSSNRGHDSIAVFAIDSRKGTLTSVEQASTQGKTPRGFGIDPTGGYLIAGNQNSNTIVVFRIDPKTGRLTPTGQTLEVGSPVNVEFVALR